MNKTLTRMLEKSNQVRNQEAIRKLAQIESLKSWGQSKNGELREFKLPKVKKDKVGWEIFTKLIMELKP